MRSFDAQLFQNAEAIRFFDLSPRRIIKYANAQALHKFHCSVCETLNANCVRVEDFNYTHMILTAAAISRTGFLRSIP
jgi:hypothetical protein